MAECRRQKTMGVPSDDKTSTSTTPAPAYIDDRPEIPVKDIAVPFVSVVLFLLGVCVVIAYARRRRKRVKIEEAERLRQMKIISSTYGVNRV